MRVAFRKAVLRAYSQRVKSEAKAKAETNQRKVKTIKEKFDTHKRKISLSLDVNGP